MPPAPWNPACRTLYWQRDMDGNGSFTDSGDRSIILARNVANDIVPDASEGTSYTPVFRYGYRASPERPGALDRQPTTPAWTSATVVAVSVRLIIDKKMGGNAQLRRPHDDGAPAQRRHRVRGGPMHRYKNQRGAALIMLIGITAALALLSSTLVFVIQNQQRATANERSGKQSFYAAEAALDSGRPARQGGQQDVHDG